MLPTSQPPSVLDREERVKVRTDKRGNFWFISQYFLGKSQKGFNVRFHNSCFTLPLLLKLPGVVALTSGGGRYWMFFKIPSMFFWGTEEKIQVLNSLPERKACKQKQPSSLDAKVSQHSMFTFNFSSCSRSLHGSKAGVICHHTWNKQKWWRQREVT